MSETYKITLQKAIEEEDKGNINGAAALYNQALKESGNDQGPVLFEMAHFFFGQQMFPQALRAFIKCHDLNYRTDDVENLIMEAYYVPNINEFEARFERNKAALEKYQYISWKDYPDISLLRYRFIPCSDTCFIIYDSKNKQFLYDYNLDNRNLDFKECKPNDAILIKNEFYISNIKECLEKTSDPNAILWIKSPLYLYYEDYEWFIQFLQVCDFSELISSERIVFLFGYSELKTWFSDLQVIYPKYIFSSSCQTDEVFLCLGGIYKKREDDCRLWKDELTKYYDSFTKVNIINNLYGGKPRILFITTRFSTAIQYFTRDCIDACNKLGIPSRLCIEKSDIHRNTFHEWMSNLIEFKPDIVFIIDHFRWEHYWMPDNIIHICWVQDPLDHILSTESAKKLKELDFILNIFFTSNEFNEIGYPKERVIETPVPSNPNLYKEYELTEEEKEVYKADVCAISNAGNPQVGLDLVLRMFKSDPNYKFVEKALNMAYREAYDAIYAEKLFLDKKHIKNLIIKCFNEVGLTYNDRIYEIIVDSFKSNIVMRIYRSVPFEWLHEKGYNIKLWGKEWVGHPVLNRYAQGVAQNGETLSRILNATKITVGTNFGMSTHPRVFETYLSNCFYMGVNIPQPYDWADIRKLMVEGAEIVLFYNKQDLYDKVDFYLENIEKRKEIIQNAGKKIATSLTYETMMVKVINEIAIRIEKQIKEKS